MRVDTLANIPGDLTVFPFLFGGTFIEGLITCFKNKGEAGFPFLFGGTFIEGRKGHCFHTINRKISLPFRRDFHLGEYRWGYKFEVPRFPFLFGGTFIEGFQNQR